MITSPDLKKIFGKIHSSFMIIALTNIIKIEGTYPYETPKGSIVLNFA